MSRQTIAATKENEADPTNLDFALTTAIMPAAAAQNCGVKVAIASSPYASAYSIALITEGRPGTFIGVRARTALETARSDNANMGSTDSTSHPEPT